MISPSDHADGLLLRIQAKITFLGYGGGLGRKGAITDGRIQGMGQQGQIADSVDHEGNGAANESWCGDFSRS